MKKIFLVLISTILLSACNSSKSFKLYTGDDIPKANEVTVFVPYSIKVIRLDNEKVSFPILSDTKDKIIRLKPGKSKITFIYDGFFEDDDTDDHEFVVSDKPFTCTLNTSPGESYRISHKEIDTLEEAKAFIKKPSYTVENLTNKQVTSAQFDEEFDLDASKSQFMNAFTSFWSDNYKTEDDHFSDWLKKNKYKEADEVELPATKTQK